MIRDFNLLATTSRGNEDEACSELWYLLGEIGDSAPTIEKTGVAGLIAAKTAFNPFEVIEKLRKILHERPYEFRYTLRIIPIERVVRTDLKEIQRVATELSSKIKENETFRVTVEKRFTEISTRDIIETAASNIERKVDLNKPDKILLIEVIGGLTGISVIKPDEILAVVKEKIL
ncbi:RNA methyltransferase [Candidatus Bathyarchaeota archaeon]|nr:MAG: RNA methyltransferase [Candidatus Bathyarchaeota archaeon]RJS80872.1 MAG: RNA methyltransferase [Candidatus Bathyarchaeota archaeon]RLI16037.1 MAG: RNA methyltransferase [Candidatus Bathyarchaeota archaeon]HDD70446.1 RNA methyltransferase [Candidatus Bathyarchaeota archaeon]